MGDDEPLTADRVRDALLRPLQARAWARRWKALAREQREEYVEVLREYSEVLDVKTIEVERLREQSESWRRAELAWQAWADSLLSRLGRQPEGGKLGDGPARAAIGAEVERLRGALEEMDASNCSCSLHGDALVEDVESHLFICAYSIARRALADTREPQP